MTTTTSNIINKSELIAMFASIAHKDIRVVIHPHNSNPKLWMIQIPLYSEKKFTIGEDVEIMIRDFIYDNGNIVTHLDKISLVGYDWTITRKDSEGFIFGTEDILAQFFILRPWNPNTTGRMSGVFENMVNQIIAEGRKPMLFIKDMFRALVY